jgi:predicted nucleic acid-binding protein
VKPCLVDTNVLLDVLTDDPQWSAWSAEALGLALVRGGAAINPIIYAELAPGYLTQERLDVVLESRQLVRLDLPWEAAFLAGQRYVEHRRSGGATRTPLPDFYIGAHAEVARLPLLTRDARRYRTYFPKVRLIAPTPR